MEAPFIVISENKLAVKLKRIAWPPAQKKDSTR